MEQLPSTSPPALRAALEAHRRGFTPVALRPGRKAPLMPNWTESLFTSADEVTQHWAEATKRSASNGGGVDPLNLGLVLGAAHGGLVDIDLDHPAAARLAANMFSSTAMRTGRDSAPSSHYWFRVEGYDPGLVACTLPGGQMIVEYRSSGGQSAIPPSRHPSQEDYRWYGEPWGGEVGPAVLDAEHGQQLHAKVLSIALVVTLAETWPTTGSRHAAFLPLVGGLLRDADEDGNPRIHSMWENNLPGLITMLTDLTNDKDGPRARIAETVETTRKKILSGKKVQGWPTLATLIGEETVSAARKWVEAIETLAGRPRGRLRATSSDSEGVAPRPSNADEGWSDGPTLYAVADGAAVTEDGPDRALRLALLPDEQRDPLGERRSDWERVDLGPYLRGSLKPPEPGVLHRTDGVGLIYPGRVNSLYGPGGSGKTLLAMIAMQQVMESDRNVLFVDMEDEPHGTLSRFATFGMDPDPLGRHLAYVRPELHPLASMQVDRWGVPSATDRGRVNEAVFHEVLADTCPTLVVIDGTTTLYRIHGHDTNAAVGTDIIAAWLRRLTDNGKRTVLMIDHTSKDAPPGATPMGSQHKIAMITGIALHVHTTTKPRPGQMGYGTVYVGKDRHGEVVRHAIGDDPYRVADIEFDSTDPAGAFRITLDPPDPDKVDVDFSHVKGGTASQPAPYGLAEARAVLSALGSGTGPMRNSEIVLAGGTALSRLNHKDLRTLLLELREAGEVVSSGPALAMRWELAADAASPPPWDD